MLIAFSFSSPSNYSALCAYPVGDTLGRRYGIIAYLMLCSLLRSRMFRELLLTRESFETLSVFIGVACQTAATTIPTFVVGRVFAGLGVGGTSCLVPMYQAECAPKSIRGGLVACYQWMITIGLLIAAIVVNGTKDRPTKASYQIPIGLQFIVRPPSHFPSVSVSAETHSPGQL